MKVLILGVTGMLGHKIYQKLLANVDVVGTIRGNYSEIAKYKFFNESTITPNVDVLNLSLVEETVRMIKPDVVINCTGIIKQLPSSQERLLNIWVNSLFPHQLYRICQKIGIRLIHVSTDCVFSGRKGNYQESDPSDANDIYGKTKYLGEVPDDEALTIRTSLIGRELSTSHGLIEWFLSNRGSNIRGYSNAIFSGFPTMHLANIIANIILNHQGLTGIYHVSAEPISKFTLLDMVRRKMDVEVEIQKYSDFHCDRSLDSTLFRDITGFRPLPWEKMIKEFAQDAEQYELWRSC